MRQNTKSHIYYHLYNQIFANISFPHSNMIFWHAETITKNSATFSNPGGIWIFDLAQYTAVVPFYR